MAIEYGVTLLQAVYCGGWFAVLSWLPCATANIISGMALAVLLDLQRQLGRTAGVSAGAAREVALAAAPEAMSPIRRVIVRRTLRHGVVDMCMAFGMA